MEVLLDFKKRKYSQIINTNYLFPSGAFENFLWSHLTCICLAGTLSTKEKSTVNGATDFPCFFFGKYEPVCHPLMVDMKDVMFLFMLDVLILASSANPLSWWDF